MTDNTNIYEIYTKSPDTGEGGWDILWIRTTPDRIKEYPLFDRIITVNDYPIQEDRTNIVEFV